MGINVVIPTGTSGKTGSEGKKELVQGYMHGKQWSRVLIAEGMTSCPDLPRTGPALACKTLHLGEPQSSAKLDDWSLKFQAFFASKAHLQK